MNTADNQKIKIEKAALQKVLQELEPYVIVVGSHAKGTATHFSDIDLYIKKRTEEEIEENWDENLEEHYIDKVIEIFEQNDLEWDSILIGCVSAKVSNVLLDASYLFRIHKDTPIQKIDVYGVEMMSAVDDKTIKGDDRLDYTE